MTQAFRNADVLLFVVLPYLAMFTFFLGTIMRYFKAPFTYSSLSSQFLENQQHFWGLVPFHYGIITVLAGHVVAFLVPRGLLLWNSRPLRLYILETSALIFGLLTLAGLVGAILRRITVSKIREVTTTLDWHVFALLLIQVGSGIYVAVFHPWGSSWFAAAATPYLWSLVKFSPDLGYMAMMPFAVKLHIVMAYLLIGFSPFTRLVHILVVPNPYLWRKPQVVRWYGRAEAPVAERRA
ncbi:MAG: respiratory nitrate reductase subunit gamma [Acidobacteria bacterium]|nr:respiratory nitrate reductase subunit gamma [Acidobacteriota bacterium]